MSYFQNPFAEDFLGVWVLADRQHMPTFKCPLNSGRGSEIVTAWNKGPYDLSGVDADGASTDTLEMRFALDMDDFKNWATVSFDVTTTAVSTSAVTSREVISALNADGGFSAYFEAVVGAFDNETPRVLIRQKLPVVRFKFYMLNGRAEEAIRFNAKSGVAELPTYFDRHTIASRFDFEDSVNMLIELDPSNAGGASAVDDGVIDNALGVKGKSLGLDSSTVQDDWELLRGRSGLFLFQKHTIDGSDRVTETIEYHAGADVGGLAKKISFTYSGGETNPTNVTEEPHTLTTGDLVTPP